MNIVVCSLVVGKEYQQTMAPCIASQRSYCASHSYKYVCENTQLDRKRPPAWSKIKLLQRILEQEAPDVAVWLDADMIITNNRVDIRAVLATVTEDKHLIATRDKNNINTGLLILRNTAWMKRFLKRVYRQRRFINHRWWEQMAIIHLYTNKRRVRERIAVLKASQQYLLNATPDCWAEESFLVHFAGARNKASSISQWVDRSNGMKEVNVTELQYES